MIMIVNTSRCTCTKLKECNTSEYHEAIPAYGEETDDFERDMNYFRARTMKAIWGDED